jgi:aspartate kinase
MAILVQKYGGSSLSSIGKLQQVAEHVVEARRSGRSVVVVVSAMGKTTENLLSLAREAASIKTDGKTPRGAEPARRELDMLLSTGERVSMALLSIALQARGYDAISFTGSQSGIITSDRHFDARILEVRPHRIEEELARGRIVIVAGYQGMSHAREITTLGRGGSDTTAVALTAALGAEACEIYSDVDGVYSADPRSVPAAAHLGELDYDVMQEMAELGAKVLNAQAVEWAKAHSVVIHARRTGDSFAGARVARETLIRAGGISVSTARAVVTQRGLSRLWVGPRDGAALARILAELELPVRDFRADDAGARAVLPLLNLPDWPRVRRELEAALPELHLDDQDVASLALVGLGVGSDAALIRDFYGVVQARALAFTTSPLCVSCTLRGAHAAELERSLHETFIEGPLRLSA